MCGSDGETPVLHLLIKKRQFIDAQQRLKDPAHQNEARKIDPQTGDLPLFVALRIPTAPLSLIRQLLYVYSYKDIVTLLRNNGLGGNQREMNVEGYPIFVAGSFSLVHSVPFV